MRYLSLVFLLIFMMGCSAVQPPDSLDNGEPTDADNDNFMRNFREMPPLCQQGTDEQKVDCIAQKAISDGDPVLCESIYLVELSEDSSVDKVERNSECIRKTVAAKKDPSLCDVFEDRNDTDYCIGHLAVDINDPSLCSLLSIKENEKKCKSYFESR